MSTVSSTVLFVYNCREKALYCYENSINGDIQWEYPQVETQEPATEDVDTADDAMDICTTPPPNEHEDLTATVFQTNGKFYNIFLLSQLQIHYACIHAFHRFSCN